VAGLSAGRRRRDVAVFFTIVILVVFVVTSGYLSQPRAAQAADDPFLRIQIVSIVTRAFTKTPALRPTGFWERQPAVGGQYTNIPDNGTQRSDLATYRQNAGPIPEQVNDGTFPDLNGVAARRFMIAVLWQAFSAQYGVDRVP